MTDVTKFMTFYQSDLMYDQSEWLRAARHVLNELEEFLRLPVRVPTPLEDYVKDWVCIEISSPLPFAGGLELSWRGILAAVIVEGVRPISFGATLFLYSHGRKLITRRGESFLILEYVVNSGEGKWSVRGWDSDTYREFEEFDDE